MGLSAELVTFLSRTGLMGLLVVNIVMLATVASKLIRGVLQKEWVPGWAYQETRDELARVRAERDIYRDATMRSLGVSERAVQAIQMVAERHVPKEAS